MLAGVKRIGMFLVWLIDREAAMVIVFRANLRQFQERL